MMFVVAIPLLAENSGVVAIIVILLTGMGWLFNQLSAKGQQPQPPVQRPGKPARPRNDRLQDEIDVFVQDAGSARARQKSAAAQAELAARRRNRPENATPAATPPPAPAPKRRPPGEEMSSRRAPVDQNLGRGVRTSVSEHLGGRTLQAKVEDDLKHSVNATVASHLGTFSGTAQPPDGSTQSARGAAQRLRQLFHEPGNVRRAILINAVLSRPKSLGK